MLDTNTRRALALATNAHHVGAVAQMRAVPAGGPFIAYFAHAEEAAVDAAANGER
jgi:hypothetical protein